jgi:signal transduction histidine kinase
VSEEKGRVLVVDDDRLNRLKLARSLEQQGHTVRAAASGEEALEITERESFDVILLDIVMPGLDGFEVLGRLKADPERRHLPVIVVSGLEEVDSAARCIELGAEDYLTKPFNPVFLKARLDASLRRKHLRDLEQAYLKQEVALRQNEKLATLGRLSAGLAHELNNPAAAAGRAAAQARAELERHHRFELGLIEAGLGPATLVRLRELGARALTREVSPETLDAITRSDREAAAEDWLAERGVPEAWSLAPALVAVGCREEELAAVAASFPGSHLAPVLGWLASLAASAQALEELAEATGRISAIVKALKGYVYLDRAPVQDVDLHEGLDDTLMMLRGRLRDGVRVRRDYAPDLPRIEAYGGELNQVWTNLIDNAITAMGGRGELGIATRSEGDWVVVEISDNGPGIPPDVLENVFDPFFTTKAPGEGTGLGLSISHGIIVDHHKGRIGVTSRPGETRFTVRLPVRLPSGEGA